MNEVIGGYLRQDEEEVFARYTIRYIIENGGGDNKTVGRLGWLLQYAIEEFKDRPLIGFFSRCYQDELPRDAMRFYWRTVSWVATLLLSKNEAVSVTNLELDWPMDVYKLAEVDSRILFSETHLFPSADLVALVQELFEQLVTQEQDVDKITVEKFLATMLDLYERRRKLQAEHFANMRQLKAQERGIFKAIQTARRHFYIYAKLAASGNEKKAKTLTPPSQHLKKPHAMSMSITVTVPASASGTAAGTATASRQSNGGGPASGSKVGDKAGTKKKLNGSTGAGTEEYVAVAQGQFKELQQESADISRLEETIQALDKIVKSIDQEKKSWAEQIQSLSQSNDSLREQNSLLQRAIVKYLRRPDSATLESLKKMANTTQQPTRNVHVPTAKTKDRTKSTALEPLSNLERAKSTQAPPSQLHETAASNKPTSKFSPSKAPREPTPDFNLAVGEDALVESQPATNLQHQKISAASTHVKPQTNANANIPTIDVTSPLIRFNVIDDLVVCNPELELPAPLDFTLPLSPVEDSTSAWVVCMAQVFVGNRRLRGEGSTVHEIAERQAQHSQSVDEVLLLQGRMGDWLYGYKEGDTTQEAKYFPATYVRPKEG